MKQRIKVLDFLRGVAILLVMLRHSKLSAITTQTGWIGVDLFFVLSGFLVSGLLFAEYKKNGSIRPLRFLVRRGFKIYPLFYVVLLLHILYNYVKGIPVISSEVFAEAFFYQNYSPGLIGISWSLAIEEHFYVLLSIALFCLYKSGALHKKTAIPLMCLLTVIACLALRFITWRQQPVIDPYTHFFPTHLRIDSLAAGVLVAWLYHFRQNQLAEIIRKRLGLCLLIIPLLLLPPFIYTAESVEMGTYGFTCLYLGFGLLVAVMMVYADAIHHAAGRNPAGFIYSSIAWTGVYSYSIYLIHMKAGPMLSNYVAVNIAGIPAFVIVLLYLLFNILCGYLLSLLIEKPFLRLREKYYPAN